MGRRSHRSQWGNNFSPDSLPYIFKKQASIQGSNLHLFGSAWLMDPEETAHLAVHHIEGSGLTPSPMSRLVDINNGVVSDVRLLNGEFYIVLVWLAAERVVLGRAQTIIKSYKGTHCQNRITEQCLIDDLCKELLETIAGEKGKVVSDLLHIA